MILMSINGHNIVRKNLLLAPWSKGKIPQRMIQIPMPHLIMFNDAQHLTIYVVFIENQEHLISFGG